MEDEREGERVEGGRQLPKVRGSIKCVRLKMTPPFLGRTAAVSNGTQATGLMLSGRLLGLAVWVVKAGRQEREEEPSGPERVGGLPAASSSSSGMKPVPERPHKSAPGDQTDFPLHLPFWMVQYGVWNMPDVFKDVTSGPMKCICRDCNMSNLSQRGRDEEGILEDFLAGHPISGLGLQGPDEPVLLSAHSEIFFLFFSCVLPKRAYTISFFLFAELFLPPLIISHSIDRSYWGGKWEARDHFEGASRPSRREGNFDLFLCSAARLREGSRMPREQGCGSGVGG